MTQETTKPTDMTNNMPEIVKQSLIIVGEFLAANQLPDITGNVAVRSGKDTINYQFTYQQVTNEIIEGETTDGKNTQEETGTKETEASTESAQ